MWFFLKKKEKCCNMEGCNSFFQSNVYELKVCFATSGCWMSQSFPQKWISLGHYRIDKNCPLNFLCQLWK